jgi:hypothetical protein
LTNSDASPHSDAPPRDFSLALVVCALLALTTLASWFCFRNGWILYYGDAQSHLNISRGLIDSRTPGYDQLGTVWLPVLHIICLPLVGNDWLWSTGLAGTIPVACCFVLAGVCFFLAARQIYGNDFAAGISLACFVLNPNVLYLATIPMTEIVFLAALFLAMLAVLKFRASQKQAWLAVAVLASWALSLTRYDGWFLIPFLAVWIALSALRGKLACFVIFAILACCAPLYWIAHNWWETGNALDFYNGPYSPRAIQGSKPYPGYHDWLAAIYYYFKTSQLCAGSTLLLLGAIGTLLAFRNAAMQGVLFLSLTPLFYVWSMHSSGGTPIYIPPLWPFSYYNSRYGIAAVPLCALACGAIVAAIPPGRKKVALLLPVFAASTWLLHPSPEHWICWKESQVNSIDRRAWTAAATYFMNANYRPGQGILTSTGDVTGIYSRSRIHLSETINIGNGPTWFLDTVRPDLFHPAVWAIMQDGDPLSRSLARTHSHYEDAAVFLTSKYSPPLRILERK